LQLLPWNHSTLEQTKRQHSRADGCAQMYAATLFSVVRRLPQAAHPCRAARSGHPRLPPRYQPICPAFRRRRTCRSPENRPCKQFRRPWFRRVGFRLVELEKPVAIGRLSNLDTVRLCCSQGAAGRNPSSRSVELVGKRQSGIAVTPNGPRSAVVAVLDEKGSLNRPSLTGSQLVSSHEHGSFRHALGVSFQQLRRNLYLVPCGAIEPVNAML